MKIGDGEMLELSKSYNIKLNENLQTISEKLKKYEIENCGIRKISELYFAKKGLEIKKIKKMSEIDEYLVIVSEDDKKEVRLYNENEYNASLENLAFGAELFYMLDYRILFGIKKRILSYKYNDILFYVQEVEDKNVFVSFSKEEPLENIMTVVNEISNVLNIDANNVKWENVEQIVFFDEMD